MHSDRHCPVCMPGSIGIGVSDPIIQAAVYSLSLKCIATVGLLVLLCILKELCVVFDEGFVVF